MRAAMAQRCFNPAGGRLSSLSMLRIPWETSRAALQPLVLQHEAVPWAGGTVAPPNPPGSLFPGAQPQSGPPSSSHAASLGWGLPPCGGRCGTGVAGGMCGGRGVQAASLQDTHPIFGRAGCVLGWKIFPKSCLGQGGKHRRCLKQSVPVCVWCGGCVCVLSPGQVQILPLAEEMFCVDLPGDAHGWQPSSFPTDGFQGLPFTAETGQLVPLVLGAPTPAGLSSPLHSAVLEAGGAGPREAV